MALYYRLLIQGNGKANPRKYLVMVWQRLWRPCARPTRMLWNRVNNQVGSYSLVAGRGVLGPHTPPVLQPRAELGHMFLRAHDTCYLC